MVTQEDVELAYQEAMMNMARLNRTGRAGGLSLAGSARGEFRPHGRVRTRPEPQTLLWAPGLVPWVTSGNPGAQCVPDRSHFIRDLPSRKWMTEDRAKLDVRRGRECTALPAARLPLCLGCQGAVAAPAPLFPRVLRPPQGDSGAGRREELRPYFLSIPSSPKFL